MTKELEEIKIARLNLEYAEDGYLRSKGWEYTTSKINCCWYWKKKFDGEMIMVDRDTALSIEEEKDESE